jgi:hypothetical protein
MRLSWDKQKIAEYGVEVIDRIYTGGSSSHDFLSLGVDCYKNPTSVVVLGQNVLEFYVDFVLIEFSEFSNEMGYVQVFVDSFLKKPVTVTDKNFTKVLDSFLGALNACFPKYCSFCFYFETIRIHCGDCRQDCITGRDLRNLERKNVLKLSDWVALTFIVPAYVGYLPVVLTIKHLFETNSPVPKVLIPLRELSEKERENFSDGIMIWGKYSPTTHRHYGNTPQSFVRNDIKFVYFGETKKEQLWKAFVETDDFPNILRKYEVYYSKKKGTTDVSLHIAPSEDVDRIMIEEIESRTN